LRLKAKGREPGAAADRPREVGFFVLQRFFPREPAAEPVVRGQADSIFLRDGGRAEAAQKAKQPATRSSLIQSPQQFATNLPNRKKFPEFLSLFRANLDCNGGRCLA
jgi:hypothetical protein